MAKDGKGINNLSGDQIKNKYISIIYILFLLVFPFFTFAGWSALAYPFLVFLGFIISIPYIIKFLYGKLDRNFLLLMGLIYLFFWLFTSSSFERADTSGLQNLLSHLFIHVHFSEVLVDGLSSAALIFLIIYASLSIMAIFSKKIVKSGNVEIIKENKKIKIIGILLMVLGPVLLFVGNFMPSMLRSYQIILYEAGTLFLISSISLLTFNILKDKVSTKTKLLMFLGDVFLICIFTVLIIK